MRLQKYVLVYSILRVYDKNKNNIHTQYSMKNIDGKNN